MTRIPFAGVLVGLCVCITGCANLTVAPPAATSTTAAKLRAANLQPAQVAPFTVAPEAPKGMDTSLSGLRGSTVTPSTGSWSMFLKDALVAELTAAGIYSSDSQVVIHGQLTDSRVDAAIGTGTARLAAKFSVVRQQQTVFEKEIAVDATWDSSFVGAIAIPAAMAQYTNLYSALVAKLVDDPDFIAALKP